MNKGNIHTCINDLWYDDLPEQQRARENRYYNALEEPVRYRKKSSKKNPGRCDHKHVYVNAEILITNRKGIERHFVGKVCSICNRLHSKTAKDCIFFLEKMF